MGLEDLDQLREIHERAAQAVDLVDHHDIDAAGLDIGEEPFDGRPLEGGAGDAAVVVAVVHRHPALGLLALDIGLAGLALGVQRIERHVEPFLARFAGIDRAAELAFRGLAHRAPPEFRRPKKSGPFQRVPVMARATAESDL